MKKKRGLLFLIPVVLGAFLYMFVDMLKAGAESHGIMLDVKVLLPWISAIGLLLGFVGILLTFNFLKKSRKFHSLYQEEIDDDLNETYYVQMYRNLEFGNITSNITSVAILLALVISGSEVIVLDVSRITFSLSFLELVLFLQSQKYLSKTIAIVRQLREIPRSVQCLRGRYFRFRLGMVGENACRRIGSGFYFQCRYSADY